MKSPAKTGKRISTLFFFISLLASSQNYAPFNSNVTKRFFNTASPADNDYFFYADSVKTPGFGNMIFYQYFSTQPPAGVNAQGCGFWGGTAYKADTTWLGVNFLYEAGGENLQLINKENDTLQFDFSLTAGDSVVFYESGTGKYYIKAGTIQNESVYSVTDAVKTFTIMHFNAGGAVVNSPLHGKEIKLGQQTGLVKFFDTYNFPSVEKHLTLQGQLNPLIGSYQVRFEDVFPFQPGDSLQYQGSLSSTPCSYVINYRVLARNETPDSVTIIFGNSVHYAGSNVPPSACPAASVYPNKLTFKKNSDLVGFPFNKLYGPNAPLTNFTSFESRTEDSVVTVCGKRPVYMGESRAATYCSTCACVGYADSYDLQYPKISYAVGTGIVSKKLTEYNSAHDNISLQLVYAAVGGQVCGIYVPVSLPENKIKAMAVYPSPAEDFVTISVPIDHLTVFSSDGRVVATKSRPASTIEIAGLTPGVYFFQMTKGEEVYYSRIIKL